MIQTNPLSKSNTVRAYEATGVNPCVFTSTRKDARVYTRGFFGHHAFRVLLALCAVSSLTASSHAESLLKDGDLLGILGDSITEQKQYSVFMEDYIRMCQPKNVDVLQFGWSGETAPGFLGRMKLDVLPFKPTIVTTCYGMNDGGYKPIEDATRERYNKAMTSIVETFKAGGARVIVGSPGAVDTVTYKRPNNPAEVYNTTLAALRDEAKKVADATGSTFANVYDPMIDVMAKSKAKFGDNYHVGGGDGVHPSANGHLVMAYAFLKAMNFDGQIATITVDLAGTKADASAGHVVKGIEGGAVTIESTRYPFCFGGKPGTPNATADIPEFLPFNQDLNRFTLVVNNAPAAKYNVTWGPTTKQYTAEQLKAGINLAADFIQNPFSEPFNVVERKIKDKQAFETKYFKNFVHTLADARTTIGDDPAFDAAQAVFARKHAELAKAARDAFVPVTHTISILPVQ